MFQKTTSLLLLLALVACKNQETTEKEKIKAATWLLGNWESKSAEGSLKENWSQVNDSTFSATSYFINAKDTVHFETINLQQVGEQLTYTATIKGQHNDKPVAFTLFSETEKQVIFENQKNDYPQKISYTKITADSIVAQISGKLQGKQSSEQFGLKKIK